jgi:uncharacterized membrane protein
MSACKQDWLSKLADRNGLDFNFHEKSWSGLAVGEPQSEGRHFQT